jgi:hypothetical protein
MAAGDVIHMVNEQGPKELKQFSIAKAAKKLNEIQHMEVKTLHDIPPMFAKLGEMVLYDMEFQNCIVTEFNRKVLIDRILFALIGFGMGAIVPLVIWLASFHIGG